MKHLVKGHLLKAVGSLDPTSSDFNAHSLYNTPGCLLKYLTFSENFKHPYIWGKSENFKHPYIWSKSYIWSGMFLRFILNVACLPPLVINYFTLYQVSRYYSIPCVKVYSKACPTNWQSIDHLPFFLSKQGLGRKKHLVSLIVLEKTHSFLCVLYRIVRDIKFEKQHLRL